MNAFIVDYERMHVVVMRFTAVKRKTATQDTSHCTCTFTRTRSGTRNFRYRFLSQDNASQIVSANNHVIIIISQQMEN